MIIQMFIQNIISPIFAFIIRVFPTISLPSSIAPYISSSLAFFAELFSFIDYFIPLQFLWLVIWFKTGFYVIKFIIGLIKFILGR